MKRPSERGKLYAAIKCAEIFGRISAGNGFKTQQRNLILHYNIKKKQMSVKNCKKVVCSCVFCLFIGKTRIFGSGHRFSKPSFRSKDYN